MKRNLPSRQQIADHWVGKHAKIWGDDAGDYCFACGDSFRLERAHITPRDKGGKDEASNLHVLCASCHKQSEASSDYWFWFERKKSLPDAVHVARRMALVSNEAMWSSIGDKLKARGVNKSEASACMDRMRALFT